MFPGMCSGYGIYVFMTDNLNKGILYVQNDWSDTSFNNESIYYFLFSYFNEWVY